MEKKKEKKKKEKKKKEKEKEKTIKIVEFSDDEIDLIKDILSEKDVLDDDEIENLKELKKTIATNPINLAIIFVRCYDHIEVNLHDMKNEENNYIEKVKKFISQFKILKIRNLVFDYGDGKQFGDALIEINIKNLVEKNRKDYLNLIKFFFQTFGEE